MPMSGWVRLGRSMLGTESEKTTWLNLDTPAGSLSACEVKSAEHLRGMEAPR